MALYSDDDTAPITPGSLPEIHFSINGWRVGDKWVWLLTDVRQCVRGPTGVDFVYPVGYLH